MSWTRFAILAAAGVAAIVATADAHSVAPQTTREIIRVQGYRTSETPADMKRRVILVALGKESSFAATDWQVFGFSDDMPAAKPTAVPASQRFSLQGSREDLMRFAAARPEQRVTLLAEHRPGSLDLFLVALDLCPQQ